MSARYDEEWTAGLLNSNSRLGAHAPEELLSRSGLSKGNTVVDYGCGPGFFTLPAAGIVGAEGLVYAIDVEPKMVALVAERAADAGRANVTAVLNETGRAPLPDEIADFAMCALVFHYPEDEAGRIDIATDISRLLKPGGKALLVQREGPMPFETTDALMTEAGLVCDGLQPLVEGQYTVVATKGTRQD